MHPTVDVSFALGIVVTIAALSTGHWFPWPRKLRRLEAYAYGTISIFAGIWTWLLLSDQWQLALALAAFPAAGGAVVILAYAIDHALNWLANLRANQK